MARGWERISLKKVAVRGHFAGSGEGENSRGRGAGSTQKRGNLVSRKSLGGGNLRGQGGIYTKNNRWRGEKTGPAREIWSISGVGDHFHVASGLFYGVGSDFG